MKKTRLATAGAVLLGLALVGAACGGDNSSSSGSATTKASAATTAAAGGAATTAAAGGATTVAAATDVKMPTGAKCTGLALAFFGAYTGENSGLGIPIYDGAKLAIDQFNAANPDCKVDFKKFDSQGSP